MEFQASLADSDGGGISVSARWDIRKSETTFETPSCADLEELHESLLGSWHVDLHQLIEVTMEKWESCHRGRVAPREEYEIWMIVLMFL